MRNLGSQRFPLPPYSDNFELWNRSLSLTLSESEFVFQLSGNREYQSRRGEILQRLHNGLDGIREAEHRSEKKLMELRAKLDSASRIVADAESDFKRTWHSFDRERQVALGSLKGQMKALKKQQAGVQTRKGGLLRRLFGMGLGQVSDIGRQIEAKGAEMRMTSQSTEDKMRLAKLQHEKRAKPLREQVEALRKELETQEKEYKVNDGLDVRREACSALEAVLQEIVKIAPSQEAST